MSETETSADLVNRTLLGQRERLLDLERRSLLAEQARQLAHRMRTPLSVIELICETLQVELQDRDDTAERLDPVLDAVSRLSTTLTDAVKSNRFAAGPARAVDPLQVAARLVRLHRGRVEELDGANGVRPRVLVEPTAFEAALMHGLRLIGIGSAGSAGSGSNEAPEPVLSCQAKDGAVVLRLTASGVLGSTNVDRRTDHDLMAQAAERVARESGGSLTIDGNTVTFRLPIADC